MIHIAQFVDIADHMVGFPYTKYGSRWGAQPMKLFEFKFSWGQIHEARRKGKRIEVTTVNGGRERSNSDTAMAVYHPGFFL